MPARALLMALLFLTTTPQSAPQSQPRYPIHVESLIYPPLARQMRLKGDVPVAAQIDSEGRVQSATGTSGIILLKDYAEKNLKMWRFSQGESQEVRVTYHFVLTGKSVESVETNCTFDLPDSVTVTSQPKGPDVIEDYIER